MAEILYPKPIELFDRLNGTAKFAQTVPELFRDAHGAVGKVDLYRHIHDTILEHVPVDYLEFGVFEGWSLRQWVGMNANPESRFFGFDTFTGLPEDWTASKPAGAFDLRGVAPDIAEGRVKMIAGLFQDTLVGFLESFKPRNQVVVHVDCDLYSATLFCLATLDPHIPAGTIVIFDEFYDVLNEFRAFRDYTAAFGREAEGLGFTDRYMQVAVRLS